MLFQLTLKHILPFELVNLKEPRLIPIVVIRRSIESDSNKVDRRHSRLCVIDQFLPNKQTQISATGRNRRTHPKLPQLHVIVFGEARVVENQEWRAGRGPERDGEAALGSLPLRYDVSVAKDRAAVIFCVAHERAVTC